MKKLLILITIVFSGSALFAQSDRNDQTVLNKVKLGLRMGLNFPSLQVRNPYSPGDYKISAKFLAGLYSEIKMGKYTLQPGIMYSVKGNKAVQDSNTVSLAYPVPFTVERNMNISYLEIPVNFLYNQTVKQGTFYAGGGPYAAFGLNGRIRSIDKRSTYLKKASVTPVDFGTANNEVKSADYGINLLTGIKWKNVVDLGASYGFGFANITNNPSFKSHNRVVAFHVGYLF